MTAPAIGTAGVPDKNRADVGDTVRFGTINPPTLGQLKVDDRGDGVTTDRLMDHAAAVMADVPSVPDLCNWGRLWCTGHTTAIVGPADLDCAIDAPNSENGFMPLSLYKAGDLLSVSMTQSPNEVAPRIEVGKRLDGKTVSVWLRLTPHEALMLSMLLDTTAILGDKPLPAGPASPGAPFWLDTLCPVWCIEPHSANDAYDDRVHGGGMTEFPLTLADARDGEPAAVDVGQHRHYRWTASVIEVGVSGTGVVSLTTGETRALAGHLRDLALLASAQPATPPVATVPAPWWATKTYQAAGGEEVYHSATIGTVTVSDADARTPVTEEVRVGRDDDPNGPGEAYVWVGNVEMTPDGARQYAAVLVQAADVADADRATR